MFGWGGRLSIGYGSLVSLFLAAEVLAETIARTHGKVQHRQTIEVDCGRRLVLGVDYYTEHWPHSSMRTDLEAIKHDLGADIIRVGDFMWHEMEPVNGTFNFTLLDSLITTAADVGLEVVLATPTAGGPAWLYHENPSVFTRGPDAAEGYAGLQPVFGGRRQYSFNSDIYLFHAKRITEKLASRFGQHPAVTFWQVDNELGHEGSDLDFSNNSLVAWRKWLRQKYVGSIDKLNADWGTVFWSATYNSFDQIPLPLWTIPGNSRSGNENFRSNLSPGMLLDFRRFRRDSVSAFALEQVRILRDYNVRGCITTNAPGGFWSKAMDHAQIFADMDIPAYDNYPVWGGSTEAPKPETVALSLSTIRGWTSGPEKGWMIAEQLIGAQGHDIIGYNPRPGQALAWASAALLHGATALLFFRYRAAIFGQEQFCFGILDHTTPIGTGRKWKEVKDFYHLARQHEPIWSAPLRAQVALVYDMENLFAWQVQPQSTSFTFDNEALRFFEPFWRLGVSVDVISTRKLKSADDFLAYDVLLLPAPMLTTDSLVEHLTAFVEAGKSLWLGFRADIKDERSQIRRNPSRLAALAGVQVVEIESLGGSKVCQLVNSDGGTTTCDVWREGLQKLPGASPEFIWTYGADQDTKETFYRDSGFAAVARLKTATSGEVIYVGAGICQDALGTMAEQTLTARGIEYLPRHKSPWLEQHMRKDASGKLWHVYINHGAESTIVANQTLAPYTVLITDDMMKLVSQSPVRRASPRVAPKTLALYANGASEVVTGV
mmetsp:Transcript_30123/g.54953  ORF Transcript_30123/g.54953 Transcript_30123/m.54953 type:complete len:773 (-) Transcript_30123:81-2399(-)